MATHHGKEGVVTVGGTAIGNVTGFTLDTTHDVVEDTSLEDSNKSFLAGRGTFTASIDMKSRMVHTGPLRRGHLENTNYVGKTFANATS